MTRLNALRSQVLAQRNVTSADLGGHAIGHAAMCGDGGPGQLDE